MTVGEIVGLVVGDTVGEMVGLTVGEVVGWWLARRWGWGDTVGEVVGLRGMRGTQFLLKKTNKGEFFNDNQNHLESRDRLGYTYFGS